MTHMIVRFIVLLWKDLCRSACHFMLSRSLAANCSSVLCSPILARLYYQFLFIHRLEVWLKRVHSAQQVVQLISFDYNNRKIEVLWFWTNTTFRSWFYANLCMYYEHLWYEEEWLLISAIYIIRLNVVLFCILKWLHSFDLLYQDTWTNFGAAKKIKLISWRFLATFCMLI